MKTWKLTLEYDGTRYHGWQEQANARTVQGELRRAAEGYFGRQVELGGAAGSAEPPVAASGTARRERVSRWSRPV